MSLLDGLELDDSIKAQLEEKLQGYIPKDEVEGLKRNRDELLAEKKAAQEKAREIEAAKEAERLAALEEGKNYKELAQSYKDKLESYEEERKRLEQEREQNQINAKALEVASKLSEGKAAEFLAEHVRKRLKMTPDGVMVADNDGKLTAASLSDLADEFKSNPDYSLFITATKASGSGAGQSQSKPASGGASNKKFQDMTVKEKAEYLASKRK